MTSLKIFWDKKMLNGLEIKKYIVKKINDNFESEVIETYIDEAFPERSFFVYMESARMYSVNNNQNKKIYPITILYTSMDFKDRHEVNEKLQGLFDFYQMIEGVRVVIDNFNSEIMDDCIFVDFEISFNVRKSRKLEEKELVTEIKLRNGE